VKRQFIGMVGVLVFTAAACGPQEKEGSEARVPEIQVLTARIEGDSTPPVSHAFIEPGPNENGDYYDVASVELRATDDASGVESITWIMTGAHTGSGTGLGSSTWLPFLNTYGTTTITFYAKDFAGNYEPTNTITVNIVAKPPPCYEISLRDFNLFVKGNYTGGHDVRGKVAAGGDIFLEHYSIGAELPADDIDRVLVAGRNLEIKHGGIFGNAYYGGTTTADGTSTFYRGSLIQSRPFSFTTRVRELEDLSYRLAYGRESNGETRFESWGGLFFEGTDPGLNIFSVNGSVFANTRYMSISAPANSTVIINVFGASATFANFSQTFGGGINETGVVFNFPSATKLTAYNYGFFGTILAPYAHVNFSSGSFDGGLYAASMTGNAEGHLAPLRDFVFCGGGNR
jgi:choice-of-anchor A domain-containing protein